MPPSPPDTDEIRALLTLAATSGVGPGRLRALLDRFGSASAVLRASPQTLLHVPGLGPQTVRQILSRKTEAEVEEQLQRARQVGAHPVPYYAEAYPDLLRQMDDPPPLLWLRGTLAAEDDRAVAIVGTRRATAYGREVARRFAAALAEAGFTVVSGLAYGIDAEAHQGALEAGGRTLAVLGSGVDRIYPSRHGGLARRILTQGALLSEYPMGTPPDAPNFPRRNRVIAGLSRAVLVVEAYETGGALITARLALDANREVYAIPGPVHHAASRGTHALIRAGHARLVTSPEDILEDLEPQLRTSRPADPSPPPDLSPVEARLYKALDTTPVHLDVLCHRTGLDPATALAYLLNLEFRGMVRQMAGRMFLRCA